MTNPASVNADLMICRRITPPRTLVSSISFRFRVVRGNVGPRSSTFTLALGTFKVELRIFNLALTSFTLALSTFTLALTTFTLALTTFTLALTTFKLALGTFEPEVATFGRQDVCFVGFAVLFRAFRGPGPMFSIATRSIPRKSQNNQHCRSSRVELCREFSLTRIAESVYCFSVHTLSSKRFWVVSVGRT